MAVVDYGNDASLISILIPQAIDSTRKKFSSQSSLQAFKRYISDTNFMHHFSVTPEYQ